MSKKEYPAKLTTGYYRVREDWEDEASQLGAYRLLANAKAKCDENPGSRVFDNDGNVILTEGLVLQDEKIWKEVLNKDIIPENHASELYFEEPDIEAFARKLEKLYPNVRYVNRLMTHSWGQKVVRFYDPDGNLIEVGTPM